MTLLHPGVPLYDVVREFPKGRAHVALFTERANAERFIDDQHYRHEYVILTRTLDEVPKRSTVVMTTTT